MRTRRPRPAPVPRSELAGFRFPPDVNFVAVYWYLRFGLSYRDVNAKRRYQRTASTIT
jgi:transposase-like protein